MGPLVLHIAVVEGVQAMRMALLLEYVILYQARAKLSQLLPLPYVHSLLEPVKEE